MMKMYQNRIRIILALLIGYKIQRTRGVEKGSSCLNDPDLRRTMEEFVNALSGDQLTTPRLRGVSTEMTDSAESALHERVSWWNSMNTAVDDFVREFEWQNRASIIRADRHLNATNWPKKSTFIDGFSETYRLDFSFKTADQIDEVHSSVLISLAELSFLYDSGKKLMVHQKEKYMFEKVFPLMYQSWKNEKHAPNFYASTESGTLITENLNDGSHVVKETLIDSLEECKVVFKALAQFHALSVAQLDEVVYSNLNDLTPVDLWVHNSVEGRATIEALTDLTELTCRLFPTSQQEEVRSTIRNLKSVIKSTYYDGSVDGFSVVLQGATERKNIFFELDKHTSTITRCKFFNFRHSHRGSPVLDLMFYLMSSVEFQVFAEKGDSLFEFYLEELHKTLAEFKCSREYNLTMLRADLRRYKMYFIYGLTHSVPAHWVLDHASPKKVDELVPGLINIVKSKKYALFARNWMNILSSW